MSPFFIVKPALRQAQGDIIVSRRACRGVVHSKLNSIVEYHRLH